MSERDELAEILLKNVKDNKDEIKDLLDKISEEWGEEDHIYRYLHRSFKVYNLQCYTRDGITILERLDPKVGFKFKNYNLRKQFNLLTTFSTEFREAIVNGTDKKFDISHNSSWFIHTHPILLAFYIVKYTLEMCYKYSEMDEAPSLLPSGWASLLEIYNIR